MKYTIGSLGDDKPNQNTTKKSSNKSSKKKYTIGSTEEVLQSNTYSKPDVYAGKTFNFKDLSNESLKTADLTINGKSAIKKPINTPNYYSIHGEGTKKNNALMLGSVDSATLGGANLVNKTIKKMQGKTDKTAFDKAKEEHPGYYATGEALGYIPSGMAFDKLAGKALEGLALPKLAEGASKGQKILYVLKQAGRQAAQDALAGTAMATTESALKGEGTKQMWQRIKTNAAWGAGIGATLKGIGASAEALSQGAVQAAKKSLKLSSLPNAKYKIKSGEMNIKLPKPSSEVVSSKNMSKLTFGQNMQKAYTKIVDNQNPLSQFSKAAKDDTNIIASNSRNAGGTVDYIIKDALVDKNGKQIGESLQNIVKDIPKAKEKTFWEYALHKHNVSRVKQNKPVYTNYTAEMSEQAYKKLEKEHPEFKQVSDRLNKYMKDFTKAWGVDTGTIDKTLMDSLNEMYPDYVPTNRAFSELEGAARNSNKKGFVNQKAPIKKATGSSRDIINPTESIMNLVNKTVRTAKYNEVGQSLASSLRKNPQGLKQFAEIIPTSDDIVKNINKTLENDGIEGLVDNFSAQFDEVASKGHLKGGNIVTVMENGKPVQIKINNKELLDVLTGLYKSNTGDAEKLARKVTGVFKSLVTQKNPLFAIRNIARDLPTAYINGSENNPFKFLRNYGKAYKHILSNDEVFKQYKAVGGGGSNFFSTDRVADAAEDLTKKKGIFSKIGEGIEKLNNATESAPRLAEFEKVYKDTGDINKALNAANEITVNFARGGNTTKQVDAYVPYLNASVQGLDKIVRQFKNKPIESLIKGGVAITAPSVALYLLNKDDPNYQNLDNRTKDNYYVLGNGDGTFTKIPKSRELGVLFGSLFERIARQISGEKDAFKGFADNAKTNIAPANPLENNIFSPVVTRLPSNKDFAGRTIVPANMQKLSPKYQYDEKTSEIAKKIGEIANISPKQIDYLIKSYTGIIGQVGLPLTTKGADLGSSLTQQFTADPLYNNEAITDFYNNLDGLERKAADKNFVDKIPSKVVTKEEKIKNQFVKASNEITKINKIIKELQAENAKANKSIIREYQQKKLDIANKMNNMLK